MPSPLEIMLAVKRVRPCPWCGAQAGEPCRADKGRGAALTRCVHTPRLKPVAVEAAEPAGSAP